MLHKEVLGMQVVEGKAAGTTIGGDPMFDHLMLTDGAGNRYTVAAARLTKTRIYVGKEPVKPKMAS